MKDHKSAQEPVENDILVVSSGGGRCCVGSWGANASKLAFGMPEVKWCPEVLYNYFVGERDKMHTLANKESDDKEEMEEEENYFHRSISLVAVFQCDDYYRWKWR